mmetsp:Transcript_5562/g.5746  ORF Transcript_5562/g.5746 Transcript_5562/m.5746 type:complete len:701 (-) Transcript_5562:89-2191(-)
MNLEDTVRESNMSKSSLNHDKLKTSIKGCTDLILAAKKGLQKIVHALIESDRKSINKQNIGGFTALMEAVNNGHEGISQILIEAKADTNKQSKDGRTALMLAANKNRKDIALMLLNTCINIDMTSKTGRTALMYAASKGYKELVKMFLESGANPELKNEGGLTALMQAVKGKHTGAVSALLEAGARIDITDEHGRTPLLDACYLSCPNIVKLLLAAGAKDSQDNFGNTGLLCTARNVCHSAMSMMIKSGSNINAINNNGDTALLVSASNEVGMYTSIVGLVTIGKADIDIQNKAGDAAIILCIQRLCLKSVKILLDKGATVNFWNKKQRTPLLEAMLTHLPEMIQLIISADPDLNIQDKDGNTMLHCCQVPQSCERLIQLGADVNIQNNLGITPLMIALHHGCPATVRVLLEAGAIINIQNKAGQTPLMFCAMEYEQNASIKNDFDNMRILIEAGGNVNTVDENGNSALLFSSSRENSLQVVQLLLKNGANYRKTNENGDSPLIMCIQARCYTALELLVKTGADVNIRNKENKTALMFGANCQKVTRLLLQHGADVNIRDNRGKTALDYAMEKLYEWKRHGDDRRQTFSPENDEKVVSLLILCGANPWSKCTHKRLISESFSSSWMKISLTERIKDRVSDLVVNAWDRRTALLLATSSLTDDSIFRRLRDSNDDLWKYFISFLTVNPFDMKLFRDEISDS